MPPNVIISFYRIENDTFYFIHSNPYWNIPENNIMRNSSNDE